MATERLLQPSFTLVFSLLLVFLLPFGSLLASQRLAWDATASPGQRQTQQKDSSSGRGPFLHAVPACLPPLYQLRLAGQGAGRVLALVSLSGVYLQTTSGRGLGSLERHKSTSLSKSLIG